MHISEQRRLATARSTRRTFLRAAVATPLSTAAVAGAELAVAGPSSAATGDAVWTAGLNADGQLGDGTLVARPSFGVVPGLTDVDDVAGGRQHALALRRGLVHAWGDGGRGALGNGSTLDQPSPVSVTGLSGVAAITCGHYASYALLPDGTVRAWGYNATGQLGDGTLTRRLTPTPVKGLTGVTQIAAGRDMAMALLGNGTVRTWGRGVDGELGNGTNPTAQKTAVAVTGLTNVVQIAGGRNHVLALLADGTVRAWGDNTYGQVGDGTLLDRNRPVVVKGLTGVVEVEAGAELSVAVRADGSVMTWGRSNAGQLGSGARTTRKVAARVPGLPSIVGVGCGREHVLAFSSTGELWVWGSNNNGQLGLGAAGASRLVPVRVTRVGPVNAAHGGYGYSVVQVSSTP